VTADKPICSLSLDLDNQWSYMKTHGDPGWESFPSFLDLVVPRFLKILDEFGWKITVFVVGQDAALEKNREAVQMIAEAGHEIGNHSFSHEPWLHLYSRQEVEDEIDRAEEAIENVTGQRTRGFRGPGFSLSRTTLEVLGERKYLYDASTFPTFLGPFARAYYFMTSDLSTEEKEKRNALFGGFRDGLRPIKPFSWETAGRTVLEIPVTTIPFFKLPFHFSYLLYLATVSPVLAERYFGAALLLCRMARIQPSLLLHPLDFLSGDDVPALRFFPAMNTARDRKSENIYRLLELVSSHHRPVSLTRIHHLITKN
jgi:peptidoglycan/xylan/chitin deacetylase (PgdA/CDA1 family)